ncbi:protein FAM83H [Mastacembelus armatus]|uniref:Family with sequence similarity 83 member Ha n=1 Tax=Mastacembelus armatus TaxID=205130 RepID=A0A3Q3M746_9TELE|nr:protein FAM83H-like [Mastacembelus armatus]
MARRSQCSSAGDNPLDPNYLPPHYREEYRLAIDALVEEDLEGYYKFLQKSDVVDFLSTPEIQYIQNSVQVPHKSQQPEQRFLETGGGDGSSDTYWPIHSDLDIPGLDLGWPPVHPFIGPTEVTTLVNPPEPNMPSIKEQARRLIKNAHQVIAIVMDMFTDVDMFADILTAAMRNVAVYILLDEQNVHHFVNMVSNCRVNIESIQSLRVRTVSGITYHCRSGKSFKGQMMDRFLLTDCRAVLSGNYSFMWSYEKLHRCMAHLFLGQLVVTFDEEFRILFAQSQPLVIEKVLAPVDDFGILQKSKYPSERMSLYREPGKLRDTGLSEEWARHSYDERMDVDWRMVPLKKQESLEGPSDVYSRFPPQQPRMDPSFDQGPSRMHMMENPPFKRHSYAEGGRFSYPFPPQQAMPEPEIQGRQFQRGHQPYPRPEPGTETDYSGYNKFWTQDYLSTDQYSDSGLPHEMDSTGNFDPVLNYLSSTRNVDFDQSSAKLQPAADLPFGSSQPRRLSLGQPYACQTSPTPLNPADQKQFFQEHNTKSKDPEVKRGLRRWRISSYLSACDNPGDEGLPLTPPQAPDPLEEPSYPIQQTAPGIDISVTKIPNVKEFRVPAIPRVSQIPSYAKTAREQKLPDESTALAAEMKTTPTPSETSSTTEVEKAEDAEQKELKEQTKGIIRREESFRRKYNAAAPRSSRLRSSLIFSSLDQQHAPQESQTAPDQQDEESDKNEAGKTKVPFLAQVFGKRRSGREPIEWSRFIKSNTSDNSAAETSKPGNEDSKAEDKDPSKEENSKDLSDKGEEQGSLKPQSKPSDAELPRTNQPVQPPKSLLTAPLIIDMSDPDARLMFFKELAAKRKAAKAAEAEKSKDKTPIKPPADLNNTTIKMKEPEPEESSARMANISPSEGLSEKKATAEDAGKTEACESASLSLDTSDKTDSVVKSDPSNEEEQTRVSQKVEWKSNSSATSLPVSAETQSPPSESPEELKLSKPAIEESHPPTLINVTAARAPSPVQGTNDSPNVSLLSPGSVEVLPSAVLDSQSQTPQSVELEANASSPLLPPEEHTGLQINYSSDHNQDFGSQISPGDPSSSSTTRSTPAETISSSVTTEDSTLTSIMSSSDFDKIEAHGSVSTKLPEPSQSADQTSQKSTKSAQTLGDLVYQLVSSKSPSAVDSAHVKSDILHDICATGPEQSTTPLDSTTRANPEEIYAPALSEKEDSHQKLAAEQQELLEPKDLKTDGTPLSINPSSPKSGSSHVSDLESSVSRPEQNETPTTNPADLPPEQTSSPAKPDMDPEASQAETTASPQDELAHATSPSTPNLTGSVTPIPADTLLCPQNESVGSVVFPKAEKTDTNMSAAQGPTDTDKQVTTDSNMTPVFTSAETSSPAEFASEVPTEPDVPTPESVASESQPSEPPVPAGNSKVEDQTEVSKQELPDSGKKIPEDVEATSKVNKSTTQETVNSEKINDQIRRNNCSEPAEITTDEAVPVSPPFKQPKSSQSRYHSSTANVLSSSNLRDDTKLLLEQISAHSQTRNEATKESPVTDDEKEDEADKNAKKEKERGTNRGQPKETQEREKLLEKIQSMRKERKVYSRFEI